MVQELKLKEEHLRQRTAMAAEHKTGPMHELFRTHLLQQQELDRQFQLERHNLETQHTFEHHGWVGARAGGRKPGGWEGVWWG